MYYSCLIWILRFSCSGISIECPYSGGSGLGICTLQVPGSLASWCLALGLGSLVSGGGSRGTSVEPRAVTVQASALQFSALRVPEVSAQEATLCLVRPGVTVCGVPVTDGRMLVVSPLWFSSLGVHSPHLPVVGGDNSYLIAFIQVFSCLWKKDLFGNSYSILANHGKLSFSPKKPTFKSHCSAWNEGGSERVKSACLS